MTTTDWIIDVGTALGLIGGLLTRVFARDGQTVVQAGPAAASLWVGSMGARLAFIIWITHSAGEAHLAHFSIAHSITRYRLSAFSCRCRRACRGG